MIDVTIVYNDGLGRVQKYTVSLGTTAMKMFRMVMKCEDDPCDYVIRVNREKIAAEVEMEHGDRMSISPCMILGD